MADYVKRDYSGQTINRPQDYAKLEIESYDSSHIHFNYDAGWNGTNLAKKVKDGFVYRTGSNQNSQFTANANYNILAAGDYRVEVFCFTTTQAETISLKINNKNIGAPVSVQALDTFMRRVDFGIQTIVNGDIPVQVICGGHVGFITVYLRKVRLTEGDSENNGLLSIVEPAKVIVGKNKQADTLEVTVKHEDKPYSQNGFLDTGTGTGLIFQYGDSVNFYVTDVNGKLRQVFGGYLSQAILNENKTNIKLPCASRLKDAELRYPLKEITVGGAEADVTPLTYSAATLYDALMYYCQAVELPIQTSNLTELKNKIPYKVGYNVNYTNKAARDKLAVSNVIKSVDNNSVVLRNNYKKNQNQWSILWDSGWNKTGEAKGYKITTTGIFYIKYGMGEKPGKKDVKVWIPKQYTPKTKKVKKGTGIYKTVKADIGYDTDKPYRGWIEVQYSTSPGKSATRKTVNIEFTANTNTNKIGTIKAICKNNVTKQGELDVISVLQANDPSSNYYLRRIALVYKTPSDNDMYDPKTEKSSYKMIIYGAGFREGEVTTPEVLQSSGQKISDQIYSVQEKLNLNMYMQYSKDRKDDKLVLFKEDTEVNLIEFKEGKDGNVLGVNNINYTPISKLKNSIIKIFKTGDNTNSYVVSKNVESIFRFREHQDLEVLNDDVGAYYAQYLAKTDEDRNTDLKYTYTLPIEGYINVHIGQYVITTLNNAFLNDLQPIESIEIEYDPDKRPAVKTTCGLGEMNPRLRLKVNQAHVRENIQTKRTVFSGGAVEADHIDLF